MRSGRAMCGVLAVSLLAAASATNPARRTQIESWLTRLTDRDAAVRDAARLELMNLPASDVPLLRATVIAKRPTPGQADALRDVVVHLIAREMVRSMPVTQMPFIGIQYGPDNDPLLFDPSGQPIEPIGVCVGEVLPGTPAAPLFQAGDVILGLDVPGIAPAWITQPRQLGEWVTSRSPGESMTFIVRRAGRVLPVTVTPEPKPVPMGETPDEAATFADNTQVAANEAFEKAWATLPGMSP